MADPKEFEERPDLSEAERHRMSESIQLKAALVHEIIREEGEEELDRTFNALAWSGLAAGLSMGFSLVVEGLLHHHLPDAPWRPLIESFGYTTGFIIVVLGRQQLFTREHPEGRDPGADPARSREFRGPDPALGHRPARQSDRRRAFRDARRHRAGVRAQPA